MLRGLLVVVIIAVALLLLATCDGHRSPMRTPVRAAPAIQPAAGISLDDTLAELIALKTPDGVAPELFQQLKDELAKQLKNKGVSKIVSTPPTGETNRVNDLALTDHGDGTFTLTWSYRNAGDYDQDGTVGISDIMPIAIHYGEDATPDNEWVDGDNNGNVGISDITPIAMNYSSECTECVIEKSNAQEGDYTELARVWFTSALGDGRKSFEVTIELSPGNWLRVVPLDASGARGTNGLPVLAPVLLKGLPNEPANEHLPDIIVPVPPEGEVIVDDRPNGTRLLTSRTRILVVFADTATVGEVNALLGSMNATIIGAIPGIKVVVIAIPDTSDFSGLSDVLSTLQNNAVVAIAVQDVALCPARISLPSDAVEPSGGDEWHWNFPPSMSVPGWMDLPWVHDGNWGLEAVRAPQMWNLFVYAARQDNNPRTCVLDTGFNDDEDPDNDGIPDGDGYNDHPEGDLPGLQSWIFDEESEDFRPGANVFEFIESIGKTEIVADHGQFVAGIIGARFNDGTGIEGINPFVERHDSPDGHFIGVSTRLAIVGINDYDTLQEGMYAMHSTIIDDLQRMLAQWSDFRVVNVSLVYNWGAASQGEIDPNTSAAAQTVAMYQGLLVRLIAATHPEVLLVSAAGNDSWQGWWHDAETHARWGSPINWAALGPSIDIPLLGSFAPSGNIIVVEELINIVDYQSSEPPYFTEPPYRWQYCTSDETNVGGDVSAPGDDVISLVGSNIPGYTDYKSEGGTSVAAPHVTGLVGYLLVLDSSLSVTQIRTLMTETEFTRQTVLYPGDLPEGVAGPAPMIDAFAAAMGIDILHSNKTLQQALVDVDDGTRDGNLRTRIFPDDPDPDDIHTPKGDHRRGDGRTTMRDFRAWRDAYLQIHASDFSGGVSLDGSARHFKKDLNLDGAIDGAVTSPSHPDPPGEIPEPTSLTDVPDEYVYPRYDFNGDGQVDYWDVTAPFKVDPDTVCENNDAFAFVAPPGCLRDIDVLGDADLWQIAEVNGYVENVHVDPNLEGQTFGPDSRWQPARYLLGNCDASSDAPEFLRTLPDYIHSFDIHFIIDWDAIDPGLDDVMLHVLSRIDADEWYERVIIVPRVVTEPFEITVPLWTGEVVIEGHYDWADVKFGEDRKASIPGPLAG